MVMEYRQQEKYSMPRINEIATYTTNQLGMSNFTIAESPNMVYRSKYCITGWKYP